MIAQIKFTGHATDSKSRGIRILVDNNDEIAESFIESTTTDSHSPSVICSTIWPMDGQTTGQLYFYAQAYQNSGGALTIQAVSGSNQKANNLMAIKLANFGQL